jgi:hypothetical protein
MLDPVGCGYQGPAAASQCRSMALRCSLVAWCDSHVRVGRQQLQQLSSCTGKGSTASTEAAGVDWMSWAQFHLADSAQLGLYRAVAAAAACLALVWLLLGQHLGCSCACGKGS